MSTSPETDARADDRVVIVISQWLARHVSDEELMRALEQIGPCELAAGQAEALEELRRELGAEARDRAELEMVARETLEAVALG